MFQRQPTCTCRIKRLSRNGKHEEKKKQKQKKTFTLRI